MSARVLVAGIGNVFFGDDGFGVSVARRLAQQDLPASVAVRDIGIRSLHLAFDLLEGWDLLIVVDAVARGSAAGTLHVIDASTDAAGIARGHDAHGMDSRSILQMARSLGATLPPVLVVGCEVANVAEGIGLSPEVESAVPQAARLVASLIATRDAGSTSPESSSREEIRP